MNNLSLYIFLLLFTGVFFSECKKYPEDDVFIQCRRPEKRLIKYGPWVFDKLTVDGVDKSAEFRADSAFCYFIIFSDLDDLITPDLTIGNILGTYSLNDNKSEMKLSVYQNISVAGDYFFFYQDRNWLIKQLTKNGLTIETTFNGQIYKLELKPED